MVSRIANRCSGGSRVGVMVSQTEKTRYSRTFVSVFLVWTGLSEPVLSAANRFRYESVSFFCCRWLVAGRERRLILGCICCNGGNRGSTNRVGRPYSTSGAGLCVTEDGVAWSYV